MSKSLKYNSFEECVEEYLENTEIYVVRQY
jgi:hypothetical protein